jgi:membrane associated rhomboid family serine protease
MPPSPSDAPEPEPAALVEAGQYPDARAAFEHGLVVLALGAPYWLVPAETGFRLLVEPQVAADARQQLASFDRESATWPPAPPPRERARRRMDFATPLLWCELVLIAFWMQGVWPGLTEHGALDSRAVFERHEWWRVATALFLHADLAHLCANAISGVFLFAATLAAFGRARGWVLLIGAAALGNTVAVATRHGSDIRSLGASTAIFGAVGLLTGRALRVIWQSPARRWAALFVPLASGVAVLGLYGAGGFNVDVLAHTTGFAAGLLLGVVGSAPLPPPAADGARAGPKVE